MTDKWRRMNRRQLRASLAEERANMAEAQGHLGTPARLAVLEHTQRIDEMAEELSRRNITLYTAVAAIAGMVAAAASLVAALK